MKKENVLLRRLLPRVMARVRGRLGICQFVFQTVVGSYRRLKLTQNDDFTGL